VGGPNRRALELNGKSPQPQKLAFVPQQPRERLPPPQRDRAGRGRLPREAIRPQQPCLRLARTAGLGLILAHRKDFVGAEGRPAARPSASTRGSPNAPRETWAACWPRRATTRPAAAACPGGPIKHEPRYAYAHYSLGVRAAEPEGLRRRPRPHSAKTIRLTPEGRLRPTLELGKRPAQQEGSGRGRLKGVPGGASKIDPKFRRGALQRRAGPPRETGGPGRGPPRRVPGVR